MAQSQAHQSQSPQMQSPMAQHGQGLAPATRRWPVGVVLLVALALALAVPLVGRAFGAIDHAPQSQSTAAR